MNDTRPNQLANPQPPFWHEPRMHCAGLFGLQDCTSRCKGFFRLSMTSAHPRAFPSKGHEDCPLTNENYYFKHPSLTLVSATATCLFFFCNGSAPPYDDGNRTCCYVVFYRPCNPDVLEYLPTTKKNASAYENSGGDDGDDSDDGSAAALKASNRGSGLSSPPSSAGDTAAAAAAAAAGATTEGVGDGDGDVSG